MKQENQFNKLLEGVIANIDANTNNLKKRDFLHLEKKIDDFLKAVSKIPAGVQLNRFKSELESIRSEVIKSCEELNKHDINKEIDRLRQKIKAGIAGFRSELKDLEKIKKAVFDDFTGEINKLTENIKLDYEFLFDRYNRRVNLNIGSKFFELIKLEDDFEIRNFLLENIYTSNRLTHDLRGLSNTFNGQITKLISSLPQQTGIKTYNELPELEMDVTKFDLTKTTSDLKDQVANKQIFQTDSEIVREILSTILFSGISDEQSIYNVLQQKDKVNKFSDHKIKKHMKKLEQHLKELIVKLDREIDSHIEDMLYPVRSYFSKVQNMIFTIAHCEYDLNEQLKKEIDILSDEIMSKQDKSNYQLFKEMLN